MVDSKQFKDWLSVRARLRAEQRAFRDARAAMARGEPTDVEALSIQQSEIRALQALSTSMVRRSGTPARRRERSGPDH